MRKTIDWKKLKIKFDDWFDGFRQTKCETCGQINLKDAPEWKDQFKKIQQLVNAQVREIVKKKS